MSVMDGTALVVPVIETGHLRALGIVTKRLALLLESAPKWAWTTSRSSWRTDCASIRITPSYAILNMLDPDRGGDGKRVTMRVSWGRGLDMNDPGAFIASLKILLDLIGADPTRDDHETARNWMIAMAAAGRHDGRPIASVGMPSPFRHGWASVSLQGKTMKRSDAGHLLSKAPVTTMWHAYIDGDETTMTISTLQASVHGDPDEDGIDPTANPLETMRAVAMAWAAAGPRP
jgi:hypothetical protein